MRFFFIMLLAGAAVLSLLSGCSGGNTSYGTTGTTRAGVSGAIFSTDSVGDVNANIFSDKENVYLNGGPAHTGAAGLPDGAYYARVTTPNGDVLGKTDGAVITVSGGEFAAVYRLWDILYQTDTSGNFVLDGLGNKIPGFADSSNGEYKVWASMDGTFQSGNKTDNFKVDAAVHEDDQTELQVNKFYDANANGINDDGQPITGWLIHIADSLSYDRYTPVSMTLAPDTYTVTEGTPLESCWMHTTPASVEVTLNNGETKTVEFGNVCLGAGGGKTLGFWSNKNGQSLVGADDLAMLAGLNLRNAAGSNFDPANYSALRNWLLNATATNMAYMLSAQLAAMELNVYNGLVNGSALIYAPGAASANSLGFATVSAVMAEANTELGTHGTALSADAWRSYQEALKNALDKANNNLTFVMPTPCPFTF